LHVSHRGPGPGSMVTTHLTAPQAGKRWQMIRRGLGQLLGSGPEHYATAERHAAGLAHWTGKASLASSVRPRPCALPLAPSPGQPAPPLPGLRCGGDGIHRANGTEAWALALRSAGNCWPGGASTGAGLIAAGAETPSSLKGLRKGGRNC